MPQMKPMNWLTLFATFALTMYYYFIFLFYFMKTNISSITKNNCMSHSPVKQYKW